VSSYTNFLNLHSCISSLFDDYLITFFANLPDAFPQEVFSAMIPFVICLLLTVLLLGKQREVFLFFVFIAVEAQSG